MAKKNNNLTLTRWAQLGSKVATLMFIWSILKQYAPYELRQFFFNRARHLFDALSPYVNLYIDEFPNGSLVPYEPFSFIFAYLGENGSRDARRLRLSSPLEEKRALSVDQFEEVCDRFNGVSVWWTMTKKTVGTQNPITMRSFKLVFDRKYREFVAGEYLDHVFKEGQRIQQRNRARRLYMNSVSGSKYYYCLTPDNPSGWTSITFDHPASFDSLAMEPEKKREIIEDLLKFSRGKDFYSRIGKVWKRGYLLYGPPGTGKSTMIAAMSRLLGYDVYDLELTAVISNTELKKLLINTTSRSIIVIEDIDCSVDFTAKRNEKSKVTATVTDSSNQMVPPKKKELRITLSGLLNCIDGIWSSCGGERIIVFTTNHIKKLDPALIRTGRMDKHIELTYCGFEGFKVLAKNYLLVESHPKFEVIKALLETTKMTPADVAENLMPMFPDDDVERGLENLIAALEKAKADAAQKELDRKKKKADELKKAKDLKKAEESKEEREQAGCEMKTEDVEENIEQNQLVSQIDEFSQS